MEAKIREFAIAKGASLVGFASTADFADAPPGFSPNDILPTAQGVVVMAIAMPKGVLATNNAVVYTAHHTHVMKDLDTLAYEVAMFIEQQSGKLAMPIPADDPYFHWEDERKYGAGILSHRHAAVKAGLGTLGKNSLLITPEFGNRVELVSIVTELAFASPAQAANLCPESCRLCVEACPSGALSGNYSVEQKPCRLHIPTKSLRGHTLYRCWRCRAVCPAKG
jgi:epoxyqueuosine reductase QueG